MGKLIMLGVGHGATLDLYNTCFAIQNKDGVFLVMIKNCEFPEL